MASKEAQKGVSTEADLPNPLREDERSSPIRPDFNLLHDHAARYTLQKALRAVEGRR